MTKYLPDKNSVEEIHALERREQRWGMLGDMNFIVSPQPKILKSNLFYFIFLFSGETATYIYITIDINNNFCQRHELL